MKNLPFVLALLLGACNQVEEAHDQIHGKERLEARYIKVLDLDGDGKLDADELQQHHDDVAALHEDGGAAFFDAADTDHSGTLTAAELAAAPDPGPMVADHMDMVDADGDGSVTRDELAAAIALHAHHD